jgi:hypothetical protein
VERELFGELIEEMERYWTAQLGASEWVKRSAKDHSKGGRPPHLGAWKAASADRGTASPDPAAEIGPFNLATSLPPRQFAQSMHRRRPSHGLRQTLGAWLMQRFFGSAPQAAAAPPPAGAPEAQRHRADAWIRQSEEAALLSAFSAEDSAALAATDGAEIERRPMLRRRIIPTSASEGPSNGPSPQPPRRHTPQEVGAAYDAP